MKKSNSTKRAVQYLGFVTALFGFVALGITVDSFSGFSRPANVSDWLFLALVTLPFILGMIGAALRSYTERIRVEIAEQRAEDEPEKARFAWDLARITLESYFNRNLSQITLIFWLSVIVMLGGFGVIVWGVTGSVAFVREHSEVGDGGLDSMKNLPSIIATLAGIITEFIGATFLFIYRSTMRQATDYSKTLERINSVGMAMQILDTMPDEAKEGDLKSQTKAKLIELLVRAANEQEVHRERYSKQEVVRPPP